MKFFFSLLLPEPKKITEECSEFIIGLASFLVFKNNVSNEPFVFINAKIPLS